MTPNTDPKAAAEAAPTSQESLATIAQRLGVMLSFQADVVRELQQLGAATRALCDRTVDLHQRCFTWWTRPLERQADALEALAQHAATQTRWLIGSTVVLHASAVRPDGPGAPSERTPDDQGEDQAL